MATKVTKKQLIQKAMKVVGKTASCNKINDYLHEHFGITVTDTYLYMVRNPNKIKKKANNNNDGVATLIESAKKLIGRFGKNDAKKLIDLL